MILIVREFSPWMFREGCEHFYSPPFDTISDDYSEFLHRFPCNITHITLPEKLEDARTRLERWISDGTIVRHNDSIILLRQRFRFSGRDMERYGIIALVKVYPDDGSVIPHERTFAGPRTGRYKLMKNTGCVPEPIFLIAGNSSLHSMMKGQADKKKPVVSFTEPEGVLNDVFICSNKEFIESIIETMANEESIVADGHHRLAAIREIASEKELGDDWQYAMAYITPIDEEGLMIAGIHRIVRKIESKENFRKNLENHFGVTEEREPSDRDITLYMNHSFYKLSLKNEFLSNDIMDNIPPSIVNRFVLNELMEPSGQEMDSYIRYTDKSKEAIDAVNRNEADACILMPPWDKNVFQKCVSERKLFPQKSTFFFPKIPSGIAIYIPGANK